MQESSISPFLYTLRRRVPSRANPAFSNTRREAAFLANASAWMRTMSQAAKPSRHMVSTAAVMIPRPQKGSPSQ